MVFTDNFQEFADRFHGVKTSVMVEPDDISDCNFSCVKPQPTPSIFSQLPNRLIMDIIAMKESKENMDYHLNRFKWYNTPEFLPELGNSASPAEVNEDILEDIFMFPLAIRILNEVTDEDIEEISETLLDCGETQDVHTWIRNHVWRYPNQVALNECVSP